MPALQKIGKWSVLFQRQLGMARFRCGNHERRVPMPVSFPSGRKGDDRWVVPPLCLAGQETATVWATVVLATTPSQAPSPYDRRWRTCSGDLLESALSESHLPTKYGFCLCRARPPQCLTSDRTVECAPGS